MKSFLLIAALVLNVSQAFAGCEDGQSMAEDAVMAEAQKFIAGAKRLCKVNAEEPTPTRTGEETTVVLSCKDTFRTVKTYKVVLKEIEDAVCTVKSVTAIGSSG